MKKAAIACMAICMAATFTSCATLFAGGDPKISIEGNVKEPVTIVTSRQTYENVTLPALVRVKRHKLDGQRIQISSENQKYQDILLRKKINEWTWGNIAIGGVIGWCIDMATNCVSKPTQKAYQVQPVEE